MSTDEDIEKESQGETPKATRVTKGAIETLEMRLMKAKRPRERLKETVTAASTR